MVMLSISEKLTDTLLRFRLDADLRADGFDFFFFLLSFLVERGVVAFTFASELVSFCVLASGSSEACLSVSDLSAVNSLMARSSRSFLTSGGVEHASPRTLRLTAAALVNGNPIPSPSGFGLFLFFFRRPCFLEDVLFLLPPLLFGRAEVAATTLAPATPTFLTEDRGDRFVDVMSDSRVVASDGPTVPIGVRATESSSPSFFFSLMLGLRPDRILAAACLASDAISSRLLFSAMFSDMWAREIIIFCCRASDEPLREQGWGRKRRREPSLHIRTMFFIPPQICRFIDWRGIESERKKA